MLLTQLLLIANLVSASPVCAQETDPARITEAIVDGTDRVWIFDGDAVKTFMKFLEDKAIIVGVVSPIERVYVVEYKTKYVVFFISQGCILDSRDFFHPLLEGALP